MSRSTAVSVGSVESLLAGFVGYLREVRGVSPRTVEVYVPVARRFLAKRGGRGLGELSAAEVSQAVLDEVAAGASPVALRRYACVLRAFLRYGQFAGLIETDLSAAVLPVAGRGDRCCRRACPRRKCARCFAPAIGGSRSGGGITR